MNNNYFFDNTSFPFLMDLYRIKIKAESRQDKKALLSLRQHYPELFTVEVEEFINQAQLVAQHLDQKYGENFSSMFMIEKEINSKISH